MIITLDLDQSIHAKIIYFLVLKKFKQSWIVEIQLYPSAWEDQKTAKVYIYGS